MEKLKLGATNSKGVAYTQDEIDALNNVYDVAQTAAKEITAGLVSPETAKQMVEDAIDAVKVEHKAEVEALREKLINLGTSVQEMKITSRTQNAKMFESLEAEVEKFVEQKADQLKAFLENKPEGGSFAFKTPATTTTTNSTDVTALSASMIADNRYVDGLVMKRRDYQYIFDIADRMRVTNTEEYLIWDEEGTEDGTIAVVSESGLKPLQQLKTVSNKSQIKKVAGKVVVTTEFDKFKKRLRQYVRSLFNDHLLRGYQSVLTTQLTTAATSYVGTTLDNTIATPTDIHAIAAMCAQLEVLGYNPDTIVINPQDKWAITISQDDNGQFYVQNIPSVGANGQKTLLGLRVVTSNKITAGDVLICEAGLWKIEEMPVELKLAYGLTTTSATVSGTSVITSAEADVDYNRMRLIGEIFYHSYIPTNHAASIVMETLATVKTALEA